MNKFKSFLTNQAAKIKARRIGRHPVTRATTMIADLQTSVKDQWIRDLEFRGKNNANVDMIDVEHYNQLQALNDVITGLGRMYPELASTTAVIDIKATQAQIHATVGIVKPAKAPAKVQQMAAGAKP